MTIHFHSVFPMLWTVICGFLTPHSYLFIVNLTINHVKSMWLGGVIQFRWGLKVKAPWWNQYFFFYKQTRACFHCLSSFVVFISVPIFLSVSLCVSVSSFSFSLSCSLISLLVLQILLLGMWWYNKRLSSYLLAWKDFGTYTVDSRTLRSQFLF